MKTIIFSDTHLIARFNKKKFEYLSFIINSADRVIINGDFWDSYYCSFDEFINSEWNKLFPLLKSKKTIYIHGNHDEKKYCDDRVNLFSDEQCYRTEIKVEDRILKIEHGHLKDIEFLGSTSFFDKYLLKHLRRLDQLAMFLEYLNHKVFFQIVRLRKIITLKGKYLKDKKENEIIVLGHTHHATFDLHAGYINTGLIRFGESDYLVVEDNKFYLVRTNY